MSKMTGVKIGVSASIIPALVLAWGMASLHKPPAAQHTDPQKNAQAPKSRHPQETDKTLNVRTYTTPNGNGDVTIFTDPVNPGQHCISKDSSEGDYPCYPNKPGLHIDNGRPLDVVHYKTPSGTEDVMMFEDPENPDIYCLGKDTGSFSCYPKPQPQPK